jgi:hypothetical protein
MACRRLFLDLQEVTRLERVHRRVHQPVRHPANPVLRAEHPWEDRVSLYGTVRRDSAGQFRMWYLTGPARGGFVQVRGRRALANITLLGYAVSDDGVHWRKPFLHQVDYEGSTANNLIDVGRTNCEGFAVLWDEGDPDPCRRYKALYWEHGGLETFIEWEGRTIWGQGEGDGMWMSFSPDGIHWANAPENPVIPHGSDTTQSLVWDPRRERYVGYGRFGAGGRRVARAESVDGVHFTPPTLVLAPDEADEDGTQFYGMPLGLYEGLYLGMLWVYREGVDGTIDTALACSRDGIRWERVLDRQTFLPLGAPGSWDDGMARVSQDFCLVGEQIYLYYGGVAGPHGGRKFRSVARQHQPAIGLATLRRDGFVSVAAGQDEGLVLTTPIVATGTELRVNAQCCGQLIVEVTDDRGMPLPAYSSAPLTGDHTNAVVRFTQPWAALAGQEIRLRFRLREADLFSYWLV